MGHYKLSGSASKDIIHIYKFGIDRFGLTQAKKYLFSLENFLEELAERPEFARDASIFAHNLYFYNHKAHVIFYLKDGDDSILVIRILGSRMNFIEHL